MLKKFYSEKGFSIIEIVISIGIVTIGLFGISSLIIQNIQVQNLNKNYLVASMLSQEGVEIVRNIRDSNWLDQGLNYDSNLLNGGGTFAVNYNGAILYGADSYFDNEAKLYINSDGFYVHDSLDNEETPFYRLITVVNNDDYYLEVDSTVKWRERGRENEYNIKTNLYNWQ